MEKSGFFSRGNGGEGNVKMCLFFCKAQQKRKSGQNSASLLVKRSRKRKSDQKSASLLVKRSKSQKLSKKQVIFRGWSGGSAELSNPMTLRRPRSSNHEAWCAKGVGGGVPDP